MLFCHTMATERLHVYGTAASIIIPRVRVVFSFNETGNEKTFWSLVFVFFKLLSSHQHCHYMQMVSEFS